MKKTYFIRIGKKLSFAFFIFFSHIQNVCAEVKEIDRYKVDFVYREMEYQILSEQERTVAVCQSYDIDALGIPRFSMPNYNVKEVELSPTGFIGNATVIPETVYDENDIPYTVTDIAYYALNYIGIDILVLPSTIQRLNYGICDVGLTTLNLPSKIRTIEGVMYCHNLKSIFIPTSVEYIGARSFMDCGFESIYFPLSLKSIDDYVLSYCTSLRSVMLSEIEYIGSNCFKNCTSLYWANLPETLISMGEGSFNGCTHLSRVSLPWSEIQMNDCFNNCPAIKTIEILANEPYPFPDNCFKEVDKSKCTLYVPENSVDLYRTAEGWKDFYQIYGIRDISSRVGIVEEASNDFDVKISDGCLIVNNLEATIVSIYSASGEKVANVNSLGMHSFSLPEGVYVVSSLTKSVKIML